jgi:hypothetical protein
MGGLGAPEIILIIVAFTLMAVFAVAIPIWGYKAGSNRTIGAVPGLFLALFLSFIGILVIYCTPKIQNKDPFAFPPRSSADELQKFKQLLDSGTITEAEFKNQKARILNTGYGRQF